LTGSCVWKSYDFKGEAAHVLRLFKDEPFVFCLDSSLRHPSRGRFSFVGFDPFMVVKASKNDPLSDIRKIFNSFRMSSRNYPTPFPAGMMGYLGYDFGLGLEKIKRKSHGKDLIPNGLLGAYDTVITIDHLAKKIIISSTGLPEKSAFLAKKRSEERIKKILKRLKQQEGRKEGFSEKIFRAQNLALKSNFTKSRYCAAVRKALDYIKKGDIYQVNLSQRFCVDIGLKCQDICPVSLYESLRALSPSYFGGYFNGGDFQIISSSPEEFLRVNNRAVETFPMKGTRPRGASKSEDQRNQKELLQSRKEKAELLMVTDLERNDLGRVCRYGTVHVKKMRVLERYKTVFQTTSAVRGILRSGQDCFDVIKACFPSGSVTGCPKIRAMEIIEELEPDRRGLYTGALGYISFSGPMNFNVLIRTLLLKKQKAYFHVGGGIVADSNPQDEYLETLVKAKALMESLKKALCRVPS